MSAHPDLVALALGQLPPREREALLARLRREPDLAREAEAVARHLALYDRLPAAPEPPSFSALVPRLGAQQPAARRWWIGVAAAAAAVLVVSLVAPREWGSSFAPAPWIRALAPREVALEDGRVRVVLDTGAEFRDEPGPRVRLESGRAWFEVGPGAFEVLTPRGAVTVLGTAFELEVGAVLRLEVAAGRVRAGGREVGPGEGLAGERRYELSTKPGRFARLAHLTLETPTPLAGSNGLQVTLVFHNPTQVPLVVPGPQTVAAGAWLAFEGPAGTRHGQGVDLVAAAQGRLPPAGQVRLAPGERLTVAVTVPRPPGPAGSWRLQALYRPEGEAPISSASVPFEIP